MNACRASGRSGVCLLAITTLLALLLPALASGSGTYKGRSARRPVIDETRYEFGKQLFLGALQPARQSEPGDSETLAVLSDHPPSEAEIVEIEIDEEPVKGDRLAFRDLEDQHEALAAIHTRLPSSAKRRSQLLEIEAPLSKREMDALRYYVKKRFRIR